MVRAVYPNGVGQWRTGLSDEGQTYFAEQLARHAASRRGQFTCKIDYNGGSTDGLVQLAHSGSIGTLEVYCDQYGKNQLADVAATSPNIKLLPQEEASDNHFDNKWLP